MAVVSASGEAPAGPNVDVVLKTVDGDEAKPVDGDVTLASMPAAEITALVHCFQKERGVTCGWVGSHFGGSHSTIFDALVPEMRKLVDAQRMPGRYRAMLDRARAEADTSVASAKEEAEAPPSAFRRQRNARLAPTSFYSIFLRFNELIGPLVEAHYNNELTRNSLLRDPVHEAFARLKEATGVERAFLCGVLALPEESLVHLPARATADLVLGMQQQRTHEAQVRETAPPKLLELIRAAFEYSAELGEVQTALQDTFDVAKLRGKYTAAQCWRMLTQHIDKLDHLQQLLQAELDKQKRDAKAVAAAVRDAIELVLASQAPAPAPAPAAELAADAPRIAELRTELPTVAAAKRASEAVAALPAEVLKREILRVLEATRVDAERRRRAESGEAPGGGGDGDGGDGDGGDGASAEVGGASVADADSTLWKPSRQVRNPSPSPDPSLNSNPNPNPNANP